MSATIAASSEQSQAPARGLGRRLAKFAGLSVMIFLAACSAVPRRGPPVVVQPDPLDSLHRVALLLPVTGPDADVGQSIANATALAMADTKVTNIRMITYDTAYWVSAKRRSRASLPRSSRKS